MKVFKNNCVSPPSSISFSDPTDFGYQSPLMFQLSRSKSLKSAARLFCDSNTCFLFVLNVATRLISILRKIYSCCWVCDSSSGWTCWLVSQVQPHAREMEAMETEGHFSGKGMIQENRSAATCCFLSWGNRGRIREWTQVESFKMTSADTQQPPSQCCWLCCCHIRKLLSGLPGTKAALHQTVPAPQSPYTSHSRGSHRCSGPWGQTGAIAEAALTGPEPTEDTSIPVLEAVQYS